MLTSRETLATLFGALTFVDYIPAGKKTQLIVKMAESLFKIEEQETLKMLEDLEGTLEYLMTQTKSNIQEKKEYGI